MNRIRTAVYWLRNMFSFMFAFFPSNLFFFFMFEYKQPCGAIEKSTEDDVFAGAGIFPQDNVDEPVSVSCHLKPCTDHQQH